MLTRQKLFSLRTLLHTVLAFAACGATSAFAQGNAANGAIAYTEKVAGASCQDCHGRRYIFVTRSLWVQTKRRSAHPSKTVSPNPE